MVDERICYTVVGTAVLFLYNITLTLATWLCWQMIKQVRSLAQPKARGYFGIDAEAYGHIGHVPMSALKVRFRPVVEQCVKSCCYVCALGSQELRHTKRGRDCRCSWHKRAGNQCSQKPSSRRRSRVWFVTFTLIRVPCLPSIYMFPTCFCPLVLPRFSPLSSLRPCAMRVCVCA